MNEIKIRFKSGEVGYFKLPDQEDVTIESVFDILGNAIKDKRAGILEVIDLVDNKRTIINISDISTFGYSYVQK